MQVKTSYITEKNKTLTSRFVFNVSNGLFPKNTTRYAQTCVFITAAI